MRYQKWGKAGCKIVCYSQDHSKMHLVKDPDCPSTKPWADDVEDMVVRDLFRFSVEMQNTEIKTPEQSVTDILNDQYAALSSKVKRLYSLYATSPDPLLLETISEHQLELSRIMKQITSEAERKSGAKRSDKAKTMVTRVADVWDTMTQNERQEIMRTLINRVTVTDGGVAIDYDL
jgi:site-specific DNA recombinase